MTEDDPAVTAPCWRVYVLRLFGGVRLVRSGLPPIDMQRTMRMFLGNDRRHRAGEGVPIAWGWLVESHNEHGPMAALTLGDLFHPTTLFHKPHTFKPDIKAERGDALVFQTWAGDPWVRMAPDRTRFLHLVPAAIEECVPEWRATCKSTTAIHATEYLCKYARARRAMGDASVADEREARRAELERLQASLRDLLVQCDAALEHVSRTFPRPGP